MQKVTVWFYESTNASGDVTYWVDNDAAIALARLMEKVWFSAYDIQRIKDYGYDVVTSKKRATIERNVDVLA